MKLHKRKDGKYSFIGMTKEEVSVIRGLLGLTSIEMNGAETDLYIMVRDLPRICYVNISTNKSVVLARKR